MTKEKKMESDVFSSNVQAICPKCGHHYKFNIRLDSEKDDDQQKVIEKRSFTRYKKQSIVRLDESMALLADISEEGMLLSTPRIPESSEVDIKITINKQYFVLKGIVKWIKEKDSFSGMNTIGVMLVDPPNQYRKLIRSIGNAD